MGKTAELNLNNHSLVVKSGEGTEYMRTVEAYLNKKIEEVKEGTRAVSTLDVALLAALNITGEVIKTRERLEKVERHSRELTDFIEKRIGC
ncbi:MAG: cell division protein ZapA [Thermodesulfobacteriota bacterium]